MGLHSANDPEPKLAKQCFQDHKPYRAVREAVKIASLPNDSRNMNRCQEWGQPRIPILTASGGDVMGSSAQEGADNLMTDWTERMLTEIADGSRKRVRYQEYRDDDIEEEDAGGGDDGRGSSDQEDCPLQPTPVEQQGHDPAPQDLVPAEKTPASRMGPSLKKRRRMDPQGPDPDVDLDSVDQQVLVQDPGSLQHVPTIKPRTQSMSGQGPIGRKPGTRRLSEGNLQRQATVISSWLRRGKGGDGAGGVGGDVEDRQELGHDTGRPVREAGGGGEGGAREGEGRRVEVKGESKEEEEVREKNKE